MYPAVACVSVSSTGLEKSTLISRVRDALRSLSIYNWPTEWKSDDAILRKLVVAHDPRNNDHMLIGPKESGLKEILYPATSKWNGVTQDKTSDTDYVILQDPSPELIEAYVILANTRPVGLPRLWVRRTPANDGLLSQTLARLEAGNDIAVIVQDDSWIVL